MEETSYAFYGNAADTLLSFSLDRAFRDALALKTKVPDWILGMQGMSGRKYRRLVNTLVGLVPDARYLEVGSWAGSTACSAISGNRVTATCIDNWSEFGGPKDQFMAHTDMARSDDVTFRFIEDDFRNVNYSDIGKYNIYLFDGPHAYQDQFDGVTIAQPAVDAEYIQIVDDWNWPEVRQGTIDAITQLGRAITYGIEIRTTQDNSHPQQHIGENSDWHNGYFLAVLRAR
ncbi:class I SAM-dependent methyltransferase [Phreatobacter aquaticus]|uniref:Class I SAM-dependent methyltransferase n=1 Tax=Phreatobacter aquaticus TaxID=2570229 RepID=A0A4D7QII7_9HYPH|nr:class I SAM-dependent methyltransferase [Phreatobacter aquaticus]QCK86845.1 class I SAM-dependent methyltransferase [Phreatobacter aquaticus]